MLSSRRNSDEQILHCPAVPTKTATFPALSALKERLAIISSRRIAEQYNDSFGDQLSDLFGRSRWALAGLALRTWEDELRVRVDELLQENHGAICKGQAVCGPSIRHCWMLGSAKDRALPTLVLCCNEHTVLRRSMRVVIKHELLKPKGFGIKGIAPYELRLYATNGSVVQPAGFSNITDRLQKVAPAHSTAPQEPIQRASTPEEKLFDTQPQAGLIGRNVCGTGLVAEGSGKYATLGGALTVGKRYYGMTAAHLIEDPDPTIKPGASTDIAEMYDSDWAEQESDLSDDDNVAEPTMPTSQLAAANDLLVPSEISSPRVNVAMNTPSGKCPNVPIGIFKLTNLRWSHAFGQHGKTSLGT